MSKGSKSRITNQKTFNQGWDRIFNKRGNKMSVENQASSEAKSANNTVIAPNVSNSSVNASNTLCQDLMR